MITLPLFPRFRTARKSTHMRQIEIDLSQPFERVLSCVLALPLCPEDHLGNGSCVDREFREAIRELYEAANGRQVETRFGWIAIAPPVADFLKARPYYIETQIDLLIEAATRIISGPAAMNVGIMAHPTGRASLESARTQDEAKLEPSGECSKHHVPLIERPVPRPTETASN
jgi:hypothetical protein